MTVTRQRGLLLATTTWFLVVAWCTLRPDPAAVARVAALPWYCIACGDGGLTDIILNLLLFLPFGILARMAGWRATSTLAVLCLLSTMIEVSQGAFLVGRDASLGDVLCNTAGGALGWLVWPLLLQVARPHARFAHRAAIVTLTLGAAIWFGTGYAMRPWIAGPTPWYGQWNHGWPGHELFQGTIQRGLLGEMNVPNDSMDHPPAHADSLDLVLELTRIIDSTPRRPVALLRIVDDDQRVVVAVAQRHRSLRLELRTRGDGFGLRTPEWGFPDAMNIKVGEPWRFRWQWFPDRLELTSAPVSGATQPTRTVLPFSVALGWVLIHPFLNAVDQGASLWTALWLIWWFGLLGWFAGATGVRWGAIYAMAGLGAFVGASATFNLPVHPGELEIAAVAFAVMAGLGKRMAR